MKLQEKHKEFAVRRYAKYMKTNDVVQALIEEFPNELPQPPPPPKLLEYEKEIEGIDYQYNRDEYVAKEMVVMEQRYINTYDNEAQVKFEQDYSRLLEDLQKDFDLFWRKEREKSLDELLYKHRSKEKDFYKELSSELSNQLRRLNITHTQFPEKYRKLFNETRAEFFNSQCNENLPDNENIIDELETIYAYVKNLIFQEEIPAEAIKQVNMAHNLLKTIASQKQDEAQKQEER